MSDYFGALMNSSGLVAAPRPSVPTPATASAAGADIVESDVVREAAAPRPSVPMPAVASAAGADIVESDVVREGAAGPAPSRLRRGSTPVEAPLTSGRTAAEVAAAARAQHSFARPADPSDTAALDPMPPHAGSAPARPVKIAPPAAAPAAIASTTDERGHAIVRAALAWVAADPQSVNAPAFASETNQPAIPQLSPAGPSTREEHARVVVEEVDLATTRTSLRAEAVPPAQVVCMKPSESARFAAHSAPAAAPDEVVEISIGAIHVRVDAPAPQTVTRTAPAAAPASSTRSQSEWAATHSALARRAMRRI